MGKFGRKENSRGEKKISFPWTPNTRKCKLESVVLV